MGDRQRVDKPAQLSLTIPPCVGAFSTSESWEINRQALSPDTLTPVSVVSQSKLALAGMGVDPWVDRGTFPHCFLKWKGRPVFSPLFFGVDIFVLMHTVFIG